MAPIKCKLHCSNYRQQLSEYLKWETHPEAEYQTDTWVDRDTLAETYLLACCELITNRKSVDLTLIHALLRAGANPMVRVEQTSVLGKDASKSFECFWTSWLRFLQRVNSLSLERCAGEEFSDGLIQSNSINQPFTLDDVFNTTKTLLAQGADINFQIGTEAIQFQEFI